MWDKESGFLDGILQRSEKKADRCRSRQGGKRGSEDNRTFDHVKGKGTLPVDEKPSRRAVELRKTYMKNPHRKSRIL